jgi:carnitine 3-dehydrogenase
MKSIQNVAVMGAGVIGSGWIARLLINGINVNVFEHSSATLANIDKVVDNAQRTQEQLLDIDLPERGSLTVSESIAHACTDVGLIIEAIPEVLEAKQELYSQIELSADIDTVIASSTSGILPSDLQSRMHHKERLIVAHPFNPVYLLPLVEIVGGNETSKSVIDKSSEFFSSIGMFPLIINKEIPAFIADRLLESVWREALWLINDDVATTQQIDDSIRYGFGLRWAQMGLFETYRLAGGEAGMRHFISQFGPCLEWPWTHLVDVPEFNEDLVNKIASQSDEQSSMYSFDELVRKRDDNLVNFISSLKDNSWGAGSTLKEYEKRLIEKAKTVSFEDREFSKTIQTYSTTVPQKWADYNGHMNESRYLDCFSWATDSFMQIIGADGEYIDNGNSYFTLETHIRHLDEALVGDRVNVTTQLIEGVGKKLHIFHRLFHDDGRLLATGEHMLLHVNLKLRGSSNPSELIITRVSTIYQAHKVLPLPEGLGRAIGDSFK